MTVGNGNLAVTVDATGMRTFAAEYKNGIPLTTMSEWGWHSFPNTEKREHGETLRQNGPRPRPQGGLRGRIQRTAAAIRGLLQYYRVNPHRVNLGLVGLNIKDKGGRQLLLPG